MARTIRIGKGNLSAEINLENSQMFSLIRNGKEVMWNGGGPEGRKAEKGWQNSEYIMFPIIGAATNGKVMIEREQYYMTQHGISRDLPWSSTYSDSNSIIMQQTYEAYRTVKSGKGTVSMYPASFKIIKSYTIQGDTTDRNESMLRFRIYVNAMDDMAYTVGWHPAFRNAEGGTVTVVGTGKDRKRVIDERKVTHAEGSAMLFKDSKAVKFNSGDFTLLVEHNFGCTQLWDRGEGLVAIEPVAAPALKLTPHSDVIELEKIEGYRKLARNTYDHFSATIRIRN